MFSASPTLGQLAAAAVEGHHLKDLGSGVGHLMMELADRGRMADDDLRGERAGDDPTALLELDNVAAVAEHGPVGQALQDAVCHRRRLFSARNSLGSSPYVGNFT